MAGLFKETSWKITGTSGGSVSIGTPVINLAVAAGFIKFSLTDGSRTFTISGQEIGADLAVSVPNLGPLGLSGSLDEFPSDGIGNIYTGPASQNRELKSGDLSGTLAVLTFGAGSHVAGATGAVLWLSHTFTECMDFKNYCSKYDLIRGFIGAAFAPVKVIVPVAGLVDITSRTKAIGLFAGIEMNSSLLHAGIRLSFCQVSIK